MALGDNCEICNFNISVLPSGLIEVGRNMPQTWATDCIRNILQYRIFNNTKPQSREPTEDQGVHFVTKLCPQCPYCHEMCTS